jgi:hypothetical protein
MYTQYSQCTHNTVNVHTVQISNNNSYSHPCNWPLFGKHETLSNWEEIQCTLTILCVHWLYCVYIDCRYFIVFFILQNRKNKPHKFTLNIFIWFYYIININKRQRTKLFQKNFLWFCTELFSIDQSWLDVVEIVIDITYLL